MAWRRPNPGNRFGTTRTNPETGKSERLRHDGHIFHSQAELLRYQSMRDLEKAGYISGLEVHPHFRLILPDQYGQMIPVSLRGYTADLAYTDPRRDDRPGGRVVEDVKPYVRQQGSDWAYFQMKRRLMWICHGIDVDVITKKGRLELNDPWRPSDPRKRV